MKELTCEDCKHFRFHYIRRGYRYDRIDDGHCVRPRIKRRLCKTPACVHFILREKSEKPS